MRAVIVIIMLSAALASQGLAQAPPAETPLPPVDSTIESEAPALELDPSWAWGVTIKPMIWAPGFSGDIDLPASSSIDVEWIDLDEPHLAPAGMMALQIDKLRVEFRGFAVSLDEAARTSEAFNLDGSIVSVGDRVSTDVDFASFDVTGGYRVWTPIEDVENQVRLSFDLYGGMRTHSLDVSIESGGASSRDQQTWFEPIVGARIVLDLPHRFQVQSSIDFGWMPFGDDTASSFDVTASFLWLVVPNVGAEIGFRHHQFDLKSGSGADEFGMNGWLAGLYGAVTIRF